jgi:hypothetical protein
MPSRLFFVLKPSLKLLFVCNDSTSILWYTLADFYKRWIKLVAQEGGPEGPKLKFQGANSANKGPKNEHSQI